MKYSEPVMHITGLIKTLPYRDLVLLADTVYENLLNVVGAEGSGSPASALIAAVVKINPDREK